jgi:hypothetical protein
MKKYNNFTLVFQGPLHQNFIYGLLNNYKEYTDNIIISHWDTDNLDLLQYIIEYNISAKIITNKFHKNINVFNGQNVYYQVFNTLRGLEEVNTEYVVKLRTDQWFGNLEPFFEKILKNDTKYVCSNLHFRPDGLMKYHPSDKLIGGRSEILLDTFKIAMERITNNSQILLAGGYMYSDDNTVCTDELISKYLKHYDYSNPNRTLFTKYPEIPQIGTIQILPAGYIGTVPEIIIGTSFLFSKKIFPNPDNSIQLVKDNFEIVRVEDMIPYVNKFGTSEIEHNSIEIDYIEQYG